MNILGISAFYHDSAATLVRDGDILAAAQEERFTRIKGDQAFPTNAVRYCLEEGKISIQDVDLVAFYDKPFLKFQRIIATYQAMAPQGLPMFLEVVPLWLKQKLHMKKMVRNELGYEGEMIFPEHHESHAASAFFPSPYQEAAVLTLDGVGEWATTTIASGKGNELTMLGEIQFPHSLGLLYAAITYYTGFKVNSGEYKVMGLAPYGEPKFKNLMLEHLMDLKPDGSFKLDLSYFDYLIGVTMTNDKFNRLFGGPPRVPETPLTQREMDLARSVQEVTEEVMLRMAAHVHKLTGHENLCLAGGVALNCVGNGHLMRKSPFKNIWIQPAAGDAGGSLGAALMGWYHHKGQPRTANNKTDSQKGSYLGPGYSNNSIREFLSKHQLPFRELSDEELPEVVSELLATENVVGWFNGRMEFGPRALGARSIIGDARSPKMQSVMNLKIKFRESFRPFAPAVLAEKVSEWFECDRESPYMLLVAQVKESKCRKMSDSEEKLWGIDKLNVVRSEIPAVTHVDYSARLQTVHKETNPMYYKTIEAFDRRTGCPVVVNTSFNVRGEPIVCTPMDAYKCFMRTEIDYLLLGNYLLDKKAQPAFLDDIDWREVFELIDTKEPPVSEKPTSASKPPVLKSEGAPRKLVKQKAEHKPATVKQLREFGLFVGGVFLLLGLVGWYHHKPGMYLAPVGALLFIFGGIAPKSLDPVYRVWMGFAEIMGSIMTRVILTLFFFLYMAPFSALRRMFGADDLNLKLDKSADSYWQMRKNPAPSKGERLTAEF